MRNLLCLLVAVLPSVVQSELRLTVFDNTAFGGSAIFNSTTEGGISGASAVGCNQSAEFIGTLTAPADQGAALLSFAADIDTAVSALRVWVSDFLVMDTSSNKEPVVSQAKLWYNAARKDVVLCLSDTCDVTQKASHYTILSANEGNYGRVPSKGPNTTQLYFSWSPSILDNWVTNISTCPNHKYTNCGNPDGLVYSNSGSSKEKGRIAVVSYSNAGHHTMAAATAPMKAWAVAHGYTETGTLGWLDAPGSKPGATYRTGNEFCQN